MFFLVQRSTLLSVLLVVPTLTSGLSIPSSVIDTIQRGQIAVIPDFLPPSTISRLRNDAQTLYNQGEFIVDGLAGYGKNAGRKDKAGFDPSKDRSVLPYYIPSKKMNGPFASTTLGDVDARRDLTSTISGLRSELAKSLDRPGMNTPDGPNNHEISFTRFGPGANLVRHNDEHHEECKGVRGWSTPTRRSISWLIYLNEPGWDAEKDGGALRCYERISPSAYSVGSRDGDLQLGWLRATREDPKERPVFMDGRRGGESGRCALYIDSDDGKRKIYLTKTFDVDPYLFLTSDFFVQNLLIQDHNLGARFHYLEQPRSALTKYFSTDPGETIKDVAPIGGQLVIFDSVTLPHEVMATMERERWASSGWFHEAQQPEPTRQIMV